MMTYKEAELKLNYIQNSTSLADCNGDIGSYFNKMKELFIENFGECPSDQEPENIREARKFFHVDYDAYETQDTDGQITNFQTAARKVNADRQIAEFFSNKR